MENYSEKQYFQRDLLDELKKWIDRKEIIAIKGPRQAGKTTLLRMLELWLRDERRVESENILFLTFEDRDLRDKFSQDPKTFLRSLLPSKTAKRFYLFIDEFQYAQDGGQKLKLLYDIFENVKFIISGSSSLELTGKTAKFLVGRLFSFNLWQLSFGEFLRVRAPQLSRIYQEYNSGIQAFLKEGTGFSLPSSDIFEKDFEREFEDYTIWGGYPEIVKTKDQETRRIILKNIYDTYISKDVIELLRITDYSRLKTLVELLAVEMGNLINYTGLAQDSKSYFKEIKQYLTILEETFVISLLRPFSTNKTTELKKNPKAYFVDGGLRNHILQNMQNLSLRADRGQLVENAVFSQLKKSMGNEYAMKYWRTLGGAEVDFVLELRSERIPLEVKYSALRIPQISRSFHSFLRDYKPKRAIVLTKGFWGKKIVGETTILFVPVWYM
jgi:predicted AAA+ superfamily ATPase